MLGRVALYLRCGASPILSKEQDALWWRHFWIGETGRDGRVSDGRDKIGGKGGAGGCAGVAWAAAGRRLAMWFADLDGWGCCS